MAEPIAKEVRPLKSAEGSVLTTTVTWGANLAEKALASPAAVSRMVRDELFRATYAGIDWIEGINQSSFKVVREVIQRGDKLSQEAVDGLESVASAVARVIRGSGDAAGEMVSKTAASLVGTKEPSTKAA